MARRYAVSLHAATGAKRAQKKSLGETPGSN